ncbi:hypothetical protein CCUS01_14292 [Colletotrichum cuscutae]|uniref:Uncharacterized protein n=1 Tax=Colletotrichum cuscutae TaxID=1209917 RepID=A0AAJ0DLQ2_9PEZI|nr:hypothetical protein CCUS01_14292 [Colletotrichum cuscutae]
MSHLNLNLVPVDAEINLNFPVIVVDTARFDVIVNVPVEPAPVGARIVSIQKPTTPSHLQRPHLVALPV